MTLPTNDVNAPLLRVPNLVNTSRFAVLLSLIAYQLVLGAAVHKNLISSSFYLWAGAYFIIVIIALLAPSNHPRIRALQPVSGIIDIVMMAILMYLSGGIQSGFGILILPFVATACLMSSGRYAITYAAFTTIIIFFFAFLSMKTNVARFSPDETTETYVIFNAGLLSGAAFLVAWLTSFATKHIQSATTTIYKHQEQIIRLSQLNSLVLNRVQEAVVVIDIQHKILLHNAQATIYFPPALFVQQNQQRIFEPILRKWLLNSESSFEFIGEINMLPVRIRAVSMDDINPPILMLFIRSEDDINQESQADKLASLGQLTANIAHEIRNPLSAIRHANELLFEHTSDPFTQKLESMINNNVERIDKLLEEVLAINKRSDPEAQYINLKIFLPKFLQDIYLATPAAQGNIELQFFTKSHTIWFDEDHLQQILWNLVNNAWRHSQKNANAIKIYIRPSGFPNKLLIHVIDNGEGMSLETYRKLFEPFFTTVSHGTGLGLFIAHELALSNQATLQYLLDDKVFELILPRDEHD